MLELNARCKCGYGLLETMIDLCIEAGLKGIGVSIDGGEMVHDRLRGRLDFAEAVRVLKYCETRGLSTSVNTQITQTGVPQLREIFDLLLMNKVKYWQVQLTVPMGNAVDHSELLLQPFDLLTLMPLLAEFYEEVALTGCCSYRKQSWILWSV